MTKLKTLFWKIEVLAWRHGLWGVAGVLLAVCALLLWVWWLPSQQAALARAGSVRQASQARQPAQAAFAELALQGGLPSADQAADGVARLVALAGEQGVQATQADYRQEEIGMAGRWQVQMPVAGAYPQLRRYLRSAQAIPGLSIDALGMHREGGAPAVEARLSFSIWYAVKPATEQRR